MKSDQIRELFLSYFEGKGHERITSSSLIPALDPTLLFTNAGMVQFKDIFLGQDKKSFTTATSCQKCVRAGGKHNDLEEVGKTARHHTFFEMLGNFSFGDYFKEQAITFAWEFITKKLSIPKDKLWVTVFQDDYDAFELWEKHTDISSDRIVKLGGKDNFWSMGDIGPCGPCSEIFIDRGEQFGCESSSCRVGCDCDRYMELWNLVFMQYDRDAAGTLTPLPNPSIDTGMGLERISAVLQGVDSNYETDLVRPIISRIERMTTIAYGTEKESDFSFRVIADHSRAAAFLIGDDILPANEGRGYVLRRILRRAARHGKMLGLTDPFLFKGAEEVIGLMGNAYPSLKEKKDFILKVIKKEEERFGATLEHGLKILEELLDELQEANSTVLPGEELFKLYDTYGFPADLTKEIAFERGLTVDSDGFTKAMNTQKTKARASWKGANESASKNIYTSLFAQTPITKFLGYDSLESDGEVLMLLKDGVEIDSLSEGDVGELLCDKSVFYGESGGQCGDAGKFFNPSCEIEIFDTKKPVADYYVHKVKVTKGNIKKGNVVTLQVNSAKRMDTECNHSATHLLHSALKEVLGDHVKQAGSDVGPDRLRFDYSHFCAPTSDELHEVESLVNEMIRLNSPITTEVLSFEQAVETGAVALFGEKYGDEVRVVKMGDSSMELCGGTHTSCTGNIGLLKLVHEGGIAAGVRRIEALTGHLSYKFTCEESDQLASVRETLKAARGEEYLKVKKILDANKTLEKELKKVKEKLLTSGNDGIVEDAKNIKGIKVIMKRLEDVDVDNLRTFVDSSKVKIGSGVVLAGCVVDDKVALVAGVTKDLTDKLNAGKIVREIAIIVNGKGGGRADMAQAGGTDTSRLDEALENGYDVVSGML